MNRESGPHYEMPEGVSMESFESGSASTLDSISERKAVSVKTRKRRIFIPIIIIVVILTAIGGIALKNSDKLNKYFEKEPEEVLVTAEDLKFTYYSYDGNGWLEIAVDDTKVESRVLEALGNAGYADSISYKKEVSDICRNYEFIICDPEDAANSNENINGYLSNGQLVRIVMVRNDYDEIQDSYETEEQLILEFEPIIIAIDGFKETVEKNIFEDVKITSSGEDGNVTINVEYTGELYDIEESDFRIINNGKLSYGSEVKIRLKNDLIEYLYDVYGIIPNPEYLTYLIE